MCLIWSLYCFFGCTYQFSESWRIFCKHNGVQHVPGQWERICWYDNNWNGSIRETAGDTDGKRQSADSLCWHFSKSLPFLYIFWGLRSCCLHKMLFLMYVYFLHCMLEVWNYKHNIFHSFHDFQSEMFAFFRFLFAWRSEINMRVLILLILLMRKYGGDNNYFFYRSSVNLFSVHKIRFIQIW